MSTNPFAISDQLIDDTLVTALEGGITYWAISAEPTFWPEGKSKMFPDHDPWASEVLTMGADLLIKVDPDLDDSEKNPYRLTKAAMVKGIRKYCEMRHITPAAIDNDPVDAEGADVIVQLAIFGEVLFG
jgi:hypothetical protein